MNSKWPSSSRPVWLQAGIPGDDVASAILCVLYAPIFGIHVNNAIVCRNIQLIITFDLSSHECASILQVQLHYSTCIAHPDKGDRVCLYNVPSMLQLLR
jgi:hypothetical protein